ncbi:MAG: hypothetical protein WAW02_00680 [Sideroxyarcus sp.]
MIGVFVGFAKSLIGDAGQVSILRDGERGSELNVQKLAGISVLMAGQLLYSCQSCADTWQHGVSSQLTTEYETNPAVSAENPGSVWRAVFLPSYVLVTRFGENSLNAGLAFQVARASNKTLSPDRDSPSAYLNWSRPSEAGDFGLSTRYVQMATRDTGGVDATGRVPVNSTSTTRNLSGSWSKELSQRSTLSADAAYDGVSYKGSGTYTDYSTRSGGLKYSYIWNEKITSFCRVAGNKYMPANGGQTTSRVETTLGMNWKNEYLDWTVQGGRSKVTGGSSDTQGSVTAHYTGRRTQLTLDAGRAVSSSGLGGYTKADHVKAGWSYILSEYSNTGIDLERRKNYSTTLVGASTTTSSSGVWLDHSLTALWKMRAYCSRKDNQGGGAESASSNLLGLSFIYSSIDF